MKKLITGLVVCAAIIPAFALAALEVGTKAPPFTTQASLGGKVFTYSLADALKKGPVILYFYPAAFTKGCTIEAHDFADATDKYAALGATVIGVSHDNIDTLNKFSVSECRSKFAVAADTDQKIMKSYDAILAIKPEYANRTSYVIAPDDTIIYTYTSLDPADHVKNTLAALEKWNQEHKK
ncbi:peroxiredoxin [Glaciimonas soli]|uniref:thioredoxin-dependent peroxiredoxin n=1 Tax=Glaciimonas soli TaxID=2590999 RepID=A0A843YUP1_9BURK|nr:peroxiredoxin [Glaciimonas soli]MQR01363.1 redoxin domain-containing protein [Glaciimonas soli]